MGFMLENNLLGPIFPLDISYDNDLERFLVDLSHHRNHCLL